MNSYKKSIYPLFETICVKNGKILNLEFHRERFNQSFFEYYGFLPNIDIFKIDIPKYCLNGVYKLKICYNDFDFDYKFSLYEFKAINSLKIVHDDNISYNLKYFDRSHLDNLHSKKGSGDDVLIIKNSLVTDTSFCNIIFYDKKSGWFTSNSPLLKGTMRAKLLKSGIIKEKQITIDDIFNFESYKLINAMRDFQTAQANPINSIFI